MIANVTCMHFGHVPSGPIQVSDLFPILVFFLKLTTFILTA